jgi:hypothetical protein
VSGVEDDGSGQSNGTRATLLLVDELAAEVSRIRIIDALRAVAAGG